MTSEDLEINIATIEDEEDISKLFEKTFKKPLPSSSFKWWAELNKLAAKTADSELSYYGFIARIKGKTVGYTGIILRPCLIKRKPSVAGEMVNGMVDSAFRRQGISTAICSHIINNLSNLDIDIIYGLPNQLNEGALIKAGMTKLFTFRRWTYVNNHLGALIARTENAVKRVLKLKITQDIKLNHPRVSTSSCALNKIPQWVSNIHFLINRSADYWRIRYDQLAKFYITDHVNIGSYVIRLNAYGSRVSATLVDLVPYKDISIKAVQDLIKSSMDKAWLEGAQSYDVSAIDGSSQAVALQALGFQQHDSCFNIVFASSDCEMLTSLKMDTVWMTMGDFDLG